MNNKMKLALAILAIGLIIVSSFTSLVASQSMATKTITETTTKYTTTTTTITTGTKTLTRTITHTHTEYITRTLTRTRTLTKTIYITKTLTMYKTVTTIHTTTSTSTMPEEPFIESVSPHKIIKKEGRVRVKVFNPTSSEKTVTIAPVSWPDGWEIDDEEWDLDNVKVVKIGSNQHVEVYFKVRPYHVELCWRLPPWCDVPGKPAGEIRFRIKEYSKEYPVKVKAFYPIASSMKEELESQRAVLMKVYDVLAKFYEGSGQTPHIASELNKWTGSLDKMKTILIEYLTVTGHYTLATTLNSVVGGIFTGITYGAIIENLISRFRRGVAKLVCGGGYVQAAKEKVDSIIYDRLPKLIKALESLEPVETKKQLINYADDLAEVKGNLKELLGGKGLGSGECESFLSGDEIDDAKKVAEKVKYIITKIEDLSRVYIEIVNDFA